MVLTHKSMTSPPVALGCGVAYVWETRPSRGKDTPREVWAEFLAAVCLGITEGGQECFLEAQKEAMFTEVTGGICW